MVPSFFSWDWLRFGGFGPKELVEICFQHSVVDLTVLIRFPPMSFSACHKR